MFESALVDIQTVITGRQVYEPIQSVRTASNRRRCPSPQVRQSHLRSGDDSARSVRYCSVHGARRGLGPKRLTQ